MVYEGVGGVVDKFYLVFFASALDGTSIGRKIFPYDDLLSQIHASDESDFLCGGRSGDSPFHEPGASHGVEVSKRCAIIIYDNVFVVQHRKNRKCRKSLFRFLECGDITQGRIDRTYFRGKVGVDEILVALQLDRAISSYILMVVARMRVVENVHGKIEHPVVEFAVLENFLVDGSLGELVVELALRHKMIRIKIPFPDREHVHENEGQDSYLHAPSSGRGALLRRGVEPPQQGEGSRYEDKRQEGIVAK